MNINTEEIRETLSERYQDCKNDKDSTNDLLVESIIEMLGYNRRRDKTIKRIYNGDVDWTLANNICIKVYALGSSLSSDEFKKASIFGKKNRFDVLLTTNGESISIYRLKDDNYILAKTISLSTELSEDADAVLNALTKQNFSLEEIDKNIKVTEITYKDAENCFVSHAVEIGSILNGILAGQYTDATNCSEISQQFISDVVNKLNGASGMDANTKAVIDKYIARIEELTYAESDANNTIAELKQKVADLEAEIYTLSGAARKHAIEMLDLIGADKMAERSYAAVINDELIHNRDLHTFIGRLLQKLYEIKSFDAQNYIFNGSVFRIVSGDSVKYNDMVLNGTPYDIVIDNSKEDEAFSKLKTLMSKFDDIIFECRKVGHVVPNVDVKIDDSDLIDNNTQEVEKSEAHEPVKESEISLGSDEELTAEDFEGLEDLDLDNLDNDEDDDDENENSSSINNQAFGVGNDNLSESADNHRQDESDSMIDFGTTDEVNHTAIGSMNEEAETDGVSNSEDTIDGTDAIGDTDDSEEIDFSELEESDEDDFGGALEPDSQLDDSDDIDEDEEEEPIPLLVAQLKNIAQLVYSDQPIEFYNIKYVGSNQVTYLVHDDADDDEMSFDMLLCKCIEAIMAISQYEGDTKTIIKLKQKDLSAINDFIHPAKDEFRKCPKIVGTRFVVNGIESIQQIAVVLNDICAGLSISTESIFIYIQADTESPDILENYGYEESSVQLRDTGNFEPSDKPKNAQAILKGDMFNNIIINEPSLIAQKDIISSVQAVKTKYLATLLSKPDDFYECLTGMLIEATKHNIRIDKNAIGNVLGENYKLISDSPSDVSSNNIEVTISGNKYYYSSIDEWQMPATLIKVHNTLFRNTAIAVKVIIDIDAVNFYASEFDTVDANTGLAVKSYADYIAECVK